MLLASSQIRLDFLAGPQRLVAECSKRSSWWLKTHVREAAFALGGFLAAEHQVKAHATGQMSHVGMRHGFIVHVKPAAHADKVNSMR